MPGTPAPEEVPERDLELIARGDGTPPYNAGVPWPIDLRHVDHRPWDESPGDGRNRVWMRVDEAVGDDPLLHACLLLYASDLTMADPVTAQHPLVWEDLIAARGIFGASIDHAFWLHRPVRMDRWLLHVQESSCAVDGRGFTTGRFFDEAGQLVASVAQEIYIKETGEAGHGAQVHDWVAWHAPRKPEAKAVTCVETGITLTWGALDRRVGRLAYLLRHRFGLAPRDRVAMIAENDTRLFELQFACMRAGLILVPMSWRLAIGEMVTLAKDAEPGIIFHDDLWRETGDAVADAIGITDRILWSDDLANSPYDDLLAEADGFLPGTPHDEDEITHILYTSGTTGLPKGALCSWGTLRHHALNTALTARLAEPNTHHFNMVPLFHAGGLNTMTNPTLYWGGQVTTVRRFDPAVALAHLTDPAHRHHPSLRRVADVRADHRAAGIRRRKLSGPPRRAVRRLGTEDRLGPPDLAGSRLLPAALLRLDRARPERLDPRGRARPRLAQLLRPDRAVHRAAPGRCRRR